MLKQIFRSSRYVWIILALALLVRLAVVFAFYFRPDFIVDDAHFYVLVAHEPTRLIYMPHASTLAIPPLYPLFLLPFFNLIPSSMPLAQFMSARVVQAAVDTLTVAVVYLITRELFGERAGKVALTVQALDLRYAFTVGTLATETVFIALFCLFMLAYLKASDARSLRHYAGAGVLLGLAALTRPVPLLFPAVLIVHARFHPDSRRQALKGVGVLALVSLLMMAPWSVRGWLLSGSLLPGSTTAFSHLWQATRDDADEIGGIELEEAAMEDVNAATGDNSDAVSEIGPLEYIPAALSNIMAAPSHWIIGTVEREAHAYLQPYGTALLSVQTEQTFAGAIRAALSGDVPLSTLLSYPGFLRRSLMYLWHFWGLALGIPGIVLAWRSHRWKAFPLLGWILYGSALLSVLLVEPRYLFPLMFAFNIFAAYAAVRLWEAIKVRRVRPLPLVGEHS